MKQSKKIKPLQIIGAVLSLSFIVFAIFYSSTYIAPHNPMITQKSVAVRLQQLQQLASSRSNSHNKINAKQTHNAVTQSTSVAKNSSPTTSNSQSTAHSALVNTGPGNSIILGIFAVLISVIMAYVYQLKRLTS